MTVTVVRIELGVGVIRVIADSDHMRLCVREVDCLRNIATHSCWRVQALHANRLELIALIKFRARDNRNFMQNCCMT